jgi:hypothetical protein
MAELDRILKNLPSAEKVEKWLSLPNAGDQIPYSVPLVEKENGWILECKDGEVGITDHLAHYILNQRNTRS